MTVPTRPSRSFWAQEAVGAEQREEGDQADEERRVLGRRDVLEDAPEALAVGEVAALEVEGQRVADDRVVAR